MTWLNQLDKRIPIAIIAALTIAALVAFGMWSMSPAYSVVFASISSKDGGAIVAAMEQLNIPYKVSDGGTSILAPSDQVHQIRLKLAAMGLPKGGNASFDLIENQKFGVSQFVEQSNYQRALIGELEKSIQSINLVESARIILGIPKQTVFVRDQQKPTASVMLKLYQGRSLSEQQVQAIVHLVSTSIADLTTSNISVVDQSGTLLWSRSNKNNPSLAESNQLTYINEIQNNVVTRIENILTPILGAKNIRATASAEVELSSVEQSEELFKPNKEGTIRSQQINESSQPISANVSVSGIPGSISNLPGNSNAPLNDSQDLENSENNSLPSTSSTKNSSVNYEIDKTIRYLQKPLGSIKRLNVALVINNKVIADEKGNFTQQAWSETELNQITSLAKEAMGYSAAREDSISVINIPFLTEPKVTTSEQVFWKSSEFIEAVKIGSTLLFNIVIFFAAYRLVLRPLLNKLLGGENNLKNNLNNLELASGAPDSELRHIHIQKFTDSPQAKYIENLEQAKKVAKENPKLVANIIASWLHKDE
jgi:flagellar M-ring protein FliF